MPKICYTPKRFSDEGIRKIGLADKIMHEYEEQGFDLTLRQLYYQFVSMKVIPNTTKEYDKLGVLISDARLAGLLDWHHVVDRTRKSISNQHWEKPSDVLRAALESYATDKWALQKDYVEVWVEKNALIGVLNGICSDLDVRHFACVGYTSQSAMWQAAQRLLEQTGKGKQVHIIHLGDHDPSGMDMSRDIKERLEMFTYGKVHVQRVALNMSQVERYNPPPDPAKVTDSRFATYRAQYGFSSWELDALTPATIVDIVRRAVAQYRDEEAWQEAVQRETRGKLTLTSLIEQFPDVIQFLRSKRTQSAVLCADCGATTEQPHCMCLGVDLSKARAIQG